MRTTTRALLETDGSAAQSSEGGKVTQLIWNKDLKFDQVGAKCRVANDHDRDQIYGPDSRQLSIPIDFWLNRPQQHDRDIVGRPEFSPRP